VSQSRDLRNLRQWIHVKKKMNLIYDKKRKGREGKNGFVVKLLRDQTGASLGSPWDVKYQLMCT